MAAEMTRVLIVGAGTMGQQIAVACRRHGFEVALYDVDPNALAAAGRQAAQRVSGFQTDPRLAAERARILAELRVITDPVAAAAGIDLLIEAVP